MAKPEKVEAVAELKQRFEESDAALLAEFRGLKVQEMKELRRALGSDTDFKVVKNTLTRIAAREAQLEELIPMLEGSTAIAFIKGDPVEAAKGLDEIAKKYPALVIKGGILSGKVFDASQAAALAKVKPREVLLAQLAGLLKSPLQKLATLLQAPVRDLGYVIAAYLDQVEKAGPAAEAPAEAEAPAAEAPAEAEAPAAEAPAEPEAAAQPEESQAAEESATETTAEAAPEPSEATNESATTETEDRAE